MTRTFTINMTRTTTISMYTTAKGMDTRNITRVKIARVVVLVLAV
jgi:hypothetical protein